MTERRDRKRFPTAPTAVGELLQGSRELRPRGNRIDRDRWRRIVGERVAERTRPASIQDGTLLVYVASAVWAQELTLLSPAILEKLKAAGVTAAALRFRVGDVGEKTPEQTQSLPAPKAPPKAELPPDLEERLSHIEDPALRAAIAEAAAYSLGRVSEKRPARPAPRSAASRTAPTDRAEAPPSGARRDIDGKRGR
jgi:hypothetical protein